MVRVVRFLGAESLSSSGCASAPGFASFAEGFLGLGARRSFDAGGCGSGESIGESGK